MTYLEAAELIDKHKKLVGTWIKNFPFSVKTLIVVPLRTSGDERVRIYFEMRENGWENQMAINKLHPIHNDDYLPIVILEDSLVLTPYPLEEYLSFTTQKYNRP